MDLSVSVFRCGDIAYDGDERILLQYGNSYDFNASDISMAVSFGMNPYPIAYGMTFAAALTFATPLANGQIALTLSAGV
jgi:hypothetical protein